MSDKKNFLLAYNPDRQFGLCDECPEACFFGDHPTLAEVSGSMGRNIAVAWIVGQLFDLSEYCGCKDKLQGKPIEQCARIIAGQYPYFKVSELMLFFYRFKAGYYGQFYGSVDPMVITDKLKVFEMERNNAIARNEQKVRERKLEEELAESPPITWEEYCRRHGKTGPNPLTSLTLKRVGRK